jgi:hypothetical protein
MRWPPAAPHPGLPIAALDSSGSEVERHAEVEGPEPARSGAPERLIGTDIARVVDRAISAPNQADIGRLDRIVCRGV